jgi:hypothetical protein
MSSSSAAFLALAALIAAPDELEDFVNAFRKSGQPAQKLEGRRTALAALRGSPAEVSDALLDASAALDKEATALEKARDAVLGTGKTDTELQRRETLDALRVLQRSLAEELARITEPAASARTLDAALTNDDLPYTLRVAIAERAGALGTAAHAPVLRALQGLDPGSVAVALVALGAAQPAPAGATAAVLPLLGHPSATVRELAAVCVARLADPVAFEPLVDLLHRERGRTRSRVADALTMLTGEALGLMRAPWDAWWRDHREAAQRGELALGKGTPREHVTAGLAYHGIPLDGERIVFVLDVSLSMGWGMRGRGGGGRGGGPPRGGEDQGPIRIDLAKQELVRALGALSPTQSFNIVVFASSTESYEPKLTEAAPRAVARAQKWVEELDLQQATALYDGLDLAFVLGGRPFADRFYEPELDTLFVLTDGEPTLPPKPGASQGGPGGGGPGGGGGGARRGPGGVEYDSNEAILAAVERWDLFDRVVVHTIGVGGDINRELLEALARAHGGRFVQETE